MVELGRVHDAAPVEAVLGTAPGRMKAKMLRSKILFHNPQPATIGLPDGRFHCWLGRMLRSTEMERHDQSIASWRHELVV